jgi:hypothetical protein
MPPKRPPRSSASVRQVRGDRSTEPGIAAIIARLTEAESPSKVYFRNLIATAIEASTDIVTDEDGALTTRTSPDEDATYTFENIEWVGNNRPELLQAPSTLTSGMSLGGFGSSGMPSSTGGSSGRFSGAGGPPGFGGFGGASAASGGSVMPFGGASAASGGSVMPFGGASAASGGSVPPTGPLFSGFQGINMRAPQPATGGTVAAAAAAAAEERPLGAFGLEGTLTAAAARDPIDIAGDKDGVLTKNDVAVLNSLLPEGAVLNDYTPRGFLLLLNQLIDATKVAAAAAKSGASAAIGRIKTYTPIILTWIAEYFKSKERTMLSIMLNIKPMPSKERFSYDFKELNDVIDDTTGLISDDIKNIAREALILGLQSHETTYNMLASYVRLQSAYKVSGVAGTSRNLLTKSTASIAVEECNLLRAFFLYVYTFRLKQPKRKTYKELLTANPDIYAQLSEIPGGVKNAILSIFGMEEKAVVSNSLSQTTYTSSGLFLTSQESILRITDREQMGLNAVILSMLQDDDLDCNIPVRDADGNITYLSLKAEIAACLQITDGGIPSINPAALDRAKDLYDAIIAYQTKTLVTVKGPIRSGPSVGALGALTGANRAAAAARAAAEAVAVRAEADAVAAREEAASRKRRRAEATATQAAALGGAPEYPGGYSSVGFFARTVGDLAGRGVRTAANTAARVMNLPTTAASAAKRAAGSVGQTVQEVTRSFGSGFTASGAPRAIQGLQERITSLNRSIRALLARGIENITAASRTVYDITPDLLLLAFATMEGGVIRLDQLAANLQPRIQAAHQAITTIGGTTLLQTRIQINEMMSADREAANALIDAAARTLQGGGARRTRRRIHRNPNKKIRKTHRHRSTHKHRKTHGRRVRFTRRR